MSICRTPDIREALTELFANTDLRYKILVNNLVVVMVSGPENQAIRITGKVTGAANEPLAGVSVQVKGGSTGTATARTSENIP